MRRSKPGEISVRSATITEACKMRQEIAEKSKSQVEQTTRPYASLRKGGRTRQTEACVREILERIVRGESLKQICSDEHMPAECTVWKWIQYDPDFREAYYEAKKLQLDCFAEQIITISDDSSSDIRMAYDKNGNPIPEVNFEAVKRSELRVRARQWLMERLQPKKYGDKSRQELDTGNRTASQNTTIQIVLPDNGRPIEAQTIEVVNGDCTR